MSMPPAQSRTPSIQDLFDARRRFGRDFARLMRSGASTGRPTLNPNPIEQEDQDIFQLDGSYLQSLLKQSEKGKL